ncbi:MAG: N-6 DNA methylase [Acidobacteriota bacterium]
MDAAVTDHAPLPGLGGDLLAPTFLARDLPARVTSADRDAARALARWWARASRAMGPASSPRRVLDVVVLPLVERLGYVAARVAPAASGAFEGLLHDGVGRRAAVLLALPWDAPLGPAWGRAVRAGLETSVPWAIVTNGQSLRVIEAARPWTRRALEARLPIALAHPESAPVLVAVAQAATLAPAPDGGSALAALVDASDRATSGACAALGAGVLEALGALVGALDAAAGLRRQPSALLDEALTLVYRVLFLLFAEARALVPTWHRVYREAYTVESLCRRIARRGAAPGLWAGLQAIARLSHAGCRAGDLEVTPFNGRLFAPASAPLAARVRVPDAIARDVLLALATERRAGGRRAIAYADLGVEQLGSVYEAVLDYHAVRRMRGVALERTSTARKTTGSFYTPRALTEFVVRRALHPLVAGRSTADILTLRIVDPAMGSGAFLVAACRYLADACAQANLESGVWTADDDTPAARARLRRAVAERCLYGVDRNPVAVQLARLSLWLTTLAVDCPLTFLDHRLAVGNSLVGARLADLARVPGPERRRAARPIVLPLFDEAADALARSILPARARLADEPSDTIGAVRRKERDLAALVAAGAPLDAWRRAADAWCAAWCWPGPRPARGVMGDVLAGLAGGAPILPAHARRPLVDRAAALAGVLQPFHWEIAFPEVFYAADGSMRPDAGFDAVIGNPPWEMLRADARETDGATAEREDARRLASFVRDSGVYGLQGSGHPNLYRLFTERALQLARPGGGRLGLILPSTLATDQSAAPLRRALLDRARLDTLTGFHNRESIFPIHRSVRFFAVTATTGAATETVRARYGVTDPRALERLPDSPREDPPEAAPIHIARARLEQWDPQHASWPETATPADVAILARVADTVPALSAPEGWGATFGRELNATDDRRHFRPVVRGPRGGLPLYEGKHLDPFRVRGAPDVEIPHEAAGRLLPGRPWRRARVAYRDVASATNRLTLIAALVPAGALTTHTVFCLKRRLPLADERCLVALLNSLVANYLVRMRITTHVTAAVMARLPVPRPRRGDPAFAELVGLSRALARAGIEAAPADYARLNAVVARLYGLTPEEYTHIVSTFPLLPASLRAPAVAAYGANASHPANDAPVLT